MSKKRRAFSAEFKTKVVLELLEGEQTAAQISGKYEITGATLKNWKKQFLENASMAFDLSGATKEYRSEIEALKGENDALAKKLGKTTVERDWLQGKLKSSVSLSDKRELVEAGHEALSIVRQCELLGLNRSSLYYQPEPIAEADLAIMHRIDEIYTGISSAYGYRMIHKQLLEEEYAVGVNKVHRLMQRMGIQAVFPRKKKCLSVKDREHKVYPYLLREFHNDKRQVVATHSNHIWSGDITYIPIQGGFMYLSAIIDWYSRTILSWKLSSTMDTALATDVLQEAISKHGAPEYFNSDQGSQYTSREHTDILKRHGVRISMNGKGRSIDNIAIERFFRTLKYDDIYLREYRNVRELRAGINRYMIFYNFNRFHSSLNYRKPMNVYREGVEKVA